MNSDDSMEDKFPGEEEILRRLANKDTTNYSEAQRNFQARKKNYEMTLRNIKETDQIILLGKQSRRPTRDTVINQDDIINLRIEMETCLSLSEFLSNT